MITEELFKQLVFKLPEVSETPNFEIKSFAVKKKIFATLNVKENRATIKLTESDQYAFSAFDKSMIYPVPNKWGKNGWTHLNLTKISVEILQDALTAAYCNVAPTKLASIVVPKSEGFE
jgi:hypothetical protein